LTQDAIWINKIKIEARQPLYLVSKPTTIKAMGVAERSSKVAKPIVQTSQLGNMGNLETQETWDGTKQS